ncbi:unnamed protein product [Schistosoma margrebowiei]|uniref:Uncharacterized protein n=1 Tax=Schistosoma margrebowiei TaxID=48269 RepID=A0A3P8A2B9_9TREM|nr:unnamed protein product [Schistosoma margrebowiei]
MLIISSINRGECLIIYCLSTCKVLAGSSKRSKCA